MRGATDCAKRLKLLFSSLRSKLGKVSHPTVTDPITQVILGILSRGTPETKASEGLDRLRGMVVDYNELRVIPPIELAEVLHDFPDARLKCEDMARALNKIFMLEHVVALDHLADMGRKELVAYLGEIDGLEPYTAARVCLLGLRRHAIPLDEAMWALARREAIVAPRCALLEAQQFIERQVAPERALEFVALLKRQAWSEMGSAVRKGSVERIQSVPPDRTTRNMLQALSAGTAEVVEPEAAGKAPGVAAAVASKPSSGSATTAQRAPATTKPKSGEPRQSKPAAKPKPRPKAEPKPRPKRKPKPKGKRAREAKAAPSRRKRPVSKRATKAVRKPARKRPAGKPTGARTRKAARKAS